MIPSFVHLRVHSEYSLVDSTLRLPDKPEYGDPAKAKRPNVISRAELRWDHSLKDKPYGYSDKNAVTLAANVIYKF